MNTSLFAVNLPIFGEVSGFALVVLTVLFLGALVAFIIVINFFSVWIRALFSGARVTFTELIALRLRKVPVGLIVDRTWRSTIFRRTTSRAATSKWSCSR